MTSAQRNANNENFPRPMISIFTSSVCFNRKKARAVKQTRKNTNNNRKESR